MEYTKRRLNDSRKPVASVTPSRGKAGPAASAWPEPGCATMECVPEPEPTGSSPSSTAAAPTEPDAPPWPTPPSEPGGATLPHGRLRGGLGLLPRPPGLVLRRKLLLLLELLRGPLSLLLPLFGQPFLFLIHLAAS